MRDYILQFATSNSTYFSIIIVLVGLGVPWILYLDKFYPLVEQKKEVWLNDFIPWAWMVYIPSFFFIYLLPKNLIIWLTGTIAISFIIYFIPKSINIKKRMYWSFYVHNSSELDRKKWENSFIRKFIICHFWSSWIMVIFFCGKSFLLKI